jgi:hypothetical protein
MTFGMSQETDEVTEITVSAPEKYVVTIQMTEEKFKKVYDSAPMVTRVSSLVECRSSV